MQEWTRGKDRALKDTQTNASVTELSEVEMPVFRSVENVSPPEEQKGLENEEADEVLGVREEERGEQAVQSSKEEGDLISEEN